MTLEAFTEAFQSSLIAAIRSALALEGTGISVVINGFVAGSVAAQVALTGGAGQQAAVQQAQADLVRQANDPNSALRQAVPALLSASVVTPAPAGGGSDGLGIGAIVGIAVGCAIVITAVAFAIYWFFCGGSARGLPNCCDSETPKGAGNTGNPIEQGGSRAMVPVTASQSRSQLPPVDMTRVDTEVSVGANRRVSFSSRGGDPPPPQQQRPPALASAVATQRRAPGGGSAPLPAAVKKAAWKVGDPVDAHFHGDYYPAVIIEQVPPGDERCPADMPDGGFIVQWTEDNSHTLVSPNELRRSADPDAALAAAGAMADAGQQSESPRSPGGDGDWEYQVGEAVEVLWHGQWHPGTVIGRKARGQYNIDWGDSTGSTGIQGSDIRRPADRGHGGAAE